MSVKKGLHEWAKDLTENKMLSKKFEGVKDTKDIVKVANDNGYDFSEKELIDMDLGLLGDDSLSSVSGGGGPAGSASDLDLGDLGLGDLGLGGGSGGGISSGNIAVDTNIKVIIASARGNAIGQGSTAVSSPTMNIKQG